MISSRRPEILIIDDSPEQIHLVHSILKEENYLIRALTDSRKIFDSLKTALPDLILLDIVMPEVDGITICRQLKADVRYSSIPVIFLTAMNDGDSTVNGFLAGAQDYVAKPVNPRELLARVSTHVHLKQKTDKLEEAYKEIEAFNHMISHDVKAPLWAIQRLSRHLEQADKQELAEIVSIMCEKADEAVLLIDKLAEISRMVSASFHAECIAMEQLVNEAMEILAGELAGRQVELVCGKLPIVWGDRMLLRQVLVNILSNALKFTKGRERAVIEINCEETLSEYVFSVKDNGVGFDMKYRDKLFGIFQRLHSEQEFAGTGTGLIIVKKIIYRHGGKVWIVGEVDRGAECFFTLPVKP